MLGDEAVEEAHPEGGGALRHGRRVLLRPGDAGDVEMRPRPFVDEAREDLPRGAAAPGSPPADVFHAGGVAVDPAFVAPPRGPPPNGLAPPLPRRDEPLGQLLVI